MILKVLLTAGVIALVWFVARSRGRIDPIKAARDAARAVSEAQAARNPSRSPPPAKIEDLVKCPKCGAYGPQGRPCGCEKA
ncbi:MAG: hypothetical protein KDE14_15810 [Rhodobacteraceae bacterium]|nr:hypothetical protein [Paracoccaceae bacterium]